MLSTPLYSLIIALEQAPEVGSGIIAFEGHGTQNNLVT